MIENFPVDNSASEAGAESKNKKGGLGSWFKKTVAAGAVMTAGHLSNLEVRADDVSMGSPVSAIESVETNLRQYEIDSTKTTKEVSVLTSQIDNTVKEMVALDLEHTETYLRNDGPFSDCLYQISLLVQSSTKGNSEDMKVIHNKLLTLKGAVSSLFARIDVTKINTYGIDHEQDVVDMIGIVDSFVDIRTRQR